MSMFYYLAVSGSDNRRMNGQIDASNEMAARNELNRMGLSVLSISDKASAEIGTSDTVIFEFEALDRTQKKVSGTIDALDLTAAYSRLQDEFTFQVAYICRTDATNTEKEQARAQGMAEVEKVIAKKAQAEEAANNKNLKDSLSTLVKKAEQKIQEATGIEREHSSIEADAKVVAPDQDTAPRAVSRHEQTKKERQMLVAENTQPKKTNTPAHISEFKDDDFDFNQDKIADKSTHAETLDLSQAQNLAPAENSAKKSSLVMSGLGVGIAKAVASVAQATQKDASADNTGEPIVSTQEKVATALQKLPSLMQAYADKIQHASAAVFVTELLNTLIIFYTASFVLLQIATGYDLGSLSTFATQVVDSSMLLAFWAFVFIIARLLLSAQRQFHEHVILRASIMYGLATLTVTVMGINLL